MRKIVAASLGLIMLGGCGHTWAPGPGTNAADFEPSKARCSIFARHGGSDFMAIGSQSYVAGATLGYAIGEAIRSQQDFDDCMIATGWKIDDGSHRSASSTNARACLWIVRTNTVLDGSGRLLGDHKPSDPMPVGCDSLVRS